MKRNEEPRNAASSLLVELRKAMGMTQTTFAVEVLKCAVSTLARYETTSPPDGRLLLRLSRIAADAGLRDLGIKFSRLYNTEVLSELELDDYLDNELMTISRRFDHATSEQYGHLFMTLEGKDQVDAAEALLRIVSAARWAKTDSHKAEAKESLQTIRSLGPGWDWERDKQ